MAIFHFKVKIINRKSGRSAVASAAYRSGEKLVNEYDGLEHDYTKSIILNIKKSCCRTVRQKNTKIEIHYGML